MEWGVKEGARLAGLRIRKGFSQAYVAEKIGMSFQAISSWEKGHHRPSPKALHDMAFLYNVPVEEITEGPIVVTVKQEDIDVSRLKRMFAENSSVLVPCDSPKTKVDELIEIMSTLSGMTRDEIIADAIKGYIERFPFAETIYEKYFTEG